jgi:hypothetical protein
LGGKRDPALFSAWTEELKTSLVKDPAKNALREDPTSSVSPERQPGDAEAEFGRVLEVTPLSPTADRFMAQIRVEQKKPDEAVKEPLRQGQARRCPHVASSGTSFWG